MLNWMLAAYEKLKYGVGFCNSLLHLLYISLIEGILFKDDKTTDLKWSHHINVRSLQSFLFFSPHQKRSLIMLWLKSAELFPFNYTLNLQWDLLRHKSQSQCNWYAKGFYDARSIINIFLSFFLEGLISESGGISNTKYLFGKEKFCNQYSN